MSEAHNQVESRGALLRRLDELKRLLEQAKKNLTNPDFVTLTGDLDRLKDTARYCFADAGSLAQDALQEASEIRFDVSTDPSLQAQSEAECIRSFERVLDLVATVRRRVETRSEARSVVNSDPTLPDRLRRGKDCDQIIREMRRIRYFALETGKTVDEIRAENLNFSAWKLRDQLSKEDRDTFDHPNQWGPLVGYARSRLAKKYGKSPATIADWIKEYRRYLRVGGKPTH